MLCGRIISGRLVISPALPEGRALSGCANTCKIKEKNPRGRGVLVFNSCSVICFVNSAFTNGACISHLCSKKGRTNVRPLDDETSVNYSSSVKEIPLWVFAWVGSKKPPAGGVAALSSCGFSVGCGFSMFSLLFCAGA